MVRPVVHVSSFAGHFCPGVSRPVPADGDSSSVGSGFILPSSSFSSNLTHTSGGISGVSERGIQCCTVLTRVTVICAASRLRLSTCRLTVASSSSGRSPSSPSRSFFAFCQGLALPDIEIASFNSCKSDHKLTVNSEAIKDGCHASNCHRDRNRGSSSR